MKYKLLRQLYMMSGYALKGFLIQCVCLTFLLAGTGNAQKSIEEIYLTVQMKEVKVKQVFSDIEKKTPFSFAYPNNVVEGNKKISVDFKDGSLADLLRYVSRNSDLGFKRIGHTIHVNVRSEIESEVLELTLANEDISGKVTDENGEALPGASVVVRGTINGTTTNLEGNYKLNVPEGAVLAVSFVGYKTQEVVVGNRSVIDVQMKLDAEQLEEVVVVGYGTQKKSDVTGAVSSVSEEEIKAFPVLDASMALQGRAAGVQVMNNSHQPGGNVSIKIRGTNSINANNEPLYVVDGFPLNGQLRYINTNDIVSMEVLKDASATAIYGARGANGVVLITTKRGQSGKMEVNFSSTSKISYPSKKIPVLNAHEFRLLKNEAFENQNKIDGGNRPLPYTQDEVDNPEYDIDWHDETTRAAFSHYHDLGVSGGNDDIIYSASIGYKDEQGIIKTSDWKQVSTRISLESRLGKRIRLGVNLNHNSVNNGTVETDHGGNSISRSIFESFPDIPIYNDEGGWTVGNEYQYLTPTALLEGFHQQTLYDKFLNNAFATIDLGKGWKFKTTYGRELQIEKYDRYIDERTQFSAGGLARVSHTKRSSWQNENYLTYEKSLGEHTINGLAGITWSKYTLESFGTSVRGFPTDAFLTNQLSAAENLVSSTSDKQESKINSYFGRINYSYKDKYLLTGTLRFDGSSKFGTNNKYASFPSLAFGWRLGEEDFIKSINSVSNLKLRIGYGITGNQDIGNYRSSERLGSVTSVLGNRRAIGITNVQAANPDLKWEKSEQFNAGIDLGLFKNRLNVVLDIYKKVTKDLLMEAPIPATTGFSTVLKNIGSVSNQGVEFSLSSVNVDQKFKWNTDFNVSYNKNKVLKLADEGQDIFTISFVNPLTILREGLEIGSFWGLQRIGIYQNEDEVSSHLANPGTTMPGDIKYKDINNDGVIDSNDRSVLGDNNPDFIYGFTNDFSYGPWSLTVQISGVKGMEVMNLNYVTSEDRQSTTNSFRNLLNRWHGEGTGNNQVAMVRISSQLNISDYHVEDGSYLRFKNISLGYDLPQSLIERLRVSSARISASLVDWITITDYSGYDPEVSTYGGHGRQGIEFSSYPNNKSILMSLNINF